MIRVVTGFHPAGYEQYGKRFIESFAQYWSHPAELVAYTEEPIPMSRGECRSLWDCEGVAEFIARHKADPRKTGHEEFIRWGHRARGKPYNFRFDAVKFCRQCFIPRHAAADMLDGDVLVWLDGDVVFFDHVPQSFPLNPLGSADICYLGRANTHSEIGFWAVTLNQRTRRFLTHLAEVWESDMVFELAEWHSAYVFDWCRVASKLNENNLTPNGRGHVWFQSPLRLFSDHCKGARKAQGFSPERARA